jgi:hypothetical protein
MTKMTETMQQAYDHIKQQVERAHSAGSFAVWYAGSEEAYEEWLIKRASQLGEHRTREMVKKAHGRYALAMEGIVGAGEASYSTVKALERRGLVESVDEYGLSGHAVRLIG